MRLIAITNLNRLTALMESKCLCSFLLHFITHLFNLSLLDLLQGNSDIVCLQLSSLLLLHTRTDTHRHTYTHCQHTSIQHRLTPLKFPMSSHLPDSSNTNSLFIFSWSLFKRKQQAALPSAPHTRKNNRIPKVQNVPELSILPADCSAVVLKDSSPSLRFVHMGFIMQIFPADWWFHRCSRKGALSKTTRLPQGSMRLAVLTSLLPSFHYRHDHQSLWQMVGEIAPMLKCYMEVDSSYCLSRGGGLFHRKQTVSWATLEIKINF